MTAEQIKQMAEKELVAYLKGCAFSLCPVSKKYMAGHIEEILKQAEATKELQEELEKWKAEWQEQVQKATDEGYARTQLQIENGKLKKQIEKMQNCFNCKKRDMQPCRKSCEWEWDKGEF